MAPALHFLVPVEGSELSAHAVAWGIAFARRTGAVMTVCSAFDPMLSCAAAAEGALLDPGPMLAALEDDARQFCAAAVSRAGSATVVATSAVLEGDPALAIDEFARASGADLIVLGTRARAGLALGVLGSVTAAVIAASRVPVITVRAETALVQNGPVVVAVDASDASAAAVRFALTLARALEAPIHLVHVRDEERAAAALAEAAREAGAADVVCTTELREGPIVRELIAAATARGASLLATGTHGRGILGRAFFGSVAESLIRRSAIPVLIVRAARAAAAR